MKSSALVCFFILCAFTSAAHSYPYQAAFEEAYQDHPEIPRGILEAVSWNMTHIRNITDADPESCSGLPHVYGPMGLTANGKGYFRNNLRFISIWSGYDRQAIKNDPTINIKAYAKALAAFCHRGDGHPASAEDAKRGIIALSEIPTDEENDYALQSFLYVVYVFLNDPEKQHQYNFPAYSIDMERLFGKENLEVLQSPKVFTGKDGTYNQKGQRWKAGTFKSAQYPPAIWTPAPTCNYSSRNGVPVSAITLHTIQGSYAGAISWSLNCNSNVSYHYVIRSSDGQVTQMVDEADKAWHVGSENPYTIGYEHEGYVNDPSWYTTAMYNASADLSKDITQSGYGINPLRTYFGASSAGTNTLGGCTKIKGHQHYPNQTHTDPGINWNWELYYQLINDSPNITTESGTTGNFYDSGGPTGDYTDDERSLTLIQPVGATSITLNFSAFNIEANWDYLYIYDGANLAAPLIGVYTGMNNPGTITSTSGSLLLEFRSDCATTASGWSASWTSNINVNLLDSISPTTQIDPIPNWNSASLTTTFTDADQGGSGLADQYYHVSAWHGTEWRANAERGFFNDDFNNMVVHPDWNTQSGNWTVQSNALVQNDENESNTNVWAFLNDSLSNRTLFHWTGAIDGSGTNRRAGFHFFCDDPTLPNRGNSYFVWFRMDDDKIQIYRVTNDVFSLEVDEVFDFNAAQWYDYKVSYDRTTGEIQVFVDNVAAANWTDPSPLTSGGSISFRSGNAIYRIDHLQVFRLRGNATSIGIGSGNNNEIQFQNPDPLQPAGEVSSLVLDSALNLSSIVTASINVDWTPPTDIALVNDGPSADVDTIYSNTELHANWSTSVDGNSDIARFWYAVGTTPGATNIVPWTDNWNNDTVVHSGLNLTYNQTYFFSIKSENGAGLESIPIHSDGAYLAQSSTAPSANFNYSSTLICETDSIHFSNSSANATSYTWSFVGGSPAVSNQANPTIFYANSGNYDVTLIASGTGGTDTITQSLTVSVEPAPIADFTQSADTVLLPNANLFFTNNSSNANGYSWNFGDGTQSTDQDPWHNYTSTGNYAVSLIAINGNCPNDTSASIVVVLNDVSIEESELWNEVSAAPNPASDVLFLEFNLHQVANLQIGLYNSMGQEVLSTTQNNMITGHHRIPLEVHDFATGLYQLRLQAGAHQLTLPVMIR